MFKYLNFSTVYVPKIRDQKMYVWDVIFTLVALNRKVKAEPGMPLMKLFL